MLSPHIANESPAQDTRELSTITRNQTGKHQPELDRSRKRLATLATASRRTPGVTWL
jgi:hypothetical protein